MMEQWSNGVMGKFLSSNSNIPKIQQSNIPGETYE